MEGYTCIYCGKICKNSNSKRTHQRFCSQNPNREPIHLTNKGWSKGLTKDIDERIANLSKSIIETMKDRPGSFKGKHHTEETRKIISENALNKNFEKHFGKRVHLEYNGVTFDSSYEIELVKNLDENKIHWEKPKSFKYHDLDGKVHKYTPDIYLPDYSVYLDPKNNYLINNINPVLGYSDVDKINWVCAENNIRVLILDKNSLTWNAVKSMI